MNLEELKAARDAAWQQMRAIVDKATAEKRDLSAVETTELDRLNADIDGLDARAKEVEEAEKRTAAFNAAHARHNAQPAKNAPGVEFTSFRALAGGRPSTAAEFGEFVRDLRNGTRGLAEGTPASGGYIVPVTLYPELLDLALNATQVRAAGVTIVPMDTSEVFVPITLTNPVATWRNEGAPIGEDDMTFDHLDLKAKSLACLVKVTEELFDDSTVGLGSAVQSALVNALRLELDRVALFGSGVAPEPGGLMLAANGVNVTTLGTADRAAIGWGDIVTAVAAVKSKNYPVTGVLLSERTEAELAGLHDTLGQFIAPPAYLANIPRLTTNQIPDTDTVGDADNASKLIVGDWSKLALGIRTEVRLRVLSELFADEGKVGFLVSMRGDVGVLRSDAFQAVAGIVPPTAA